LTISSISDIIVSVDVPMMFSLYQRCDILGEIAMKSLVIFDTNFGNTKIIAETIAKELDNDAKAISVSDFNVGELEGIDLLVVGSPVIG
jgi:flavorubredoxin